jgi:hypothetical protein
VEAQRAALEKVKATVEELLASLKPVQVDPLKDHPELPMQHSSVVLEPSAAA